MFNFNLRRADIYTALKWDFLLLLARPMKNIFLALLFANVFIFSASFVFFQAPGLQSRSLGGLLIFLSLYLSFQIFENFFNLKIKKPVPPSSLSELIISPSKYNLASFLSFDVSKAIWRMISSGLESDSSSFLYFLISGSWKMNFIFYHLFLEPEKAVGMIQKQAEKKPDNNREFSDDLKQTLLGSLEIAIKREHKRIEAEDMLLSLAKNSGALKNVMLEFGLKSQDIENAGWWVDNLEKRAERKKRFWDYENLALKGTMAKTWTAGYTVNLDKYAIDWTEKLKKYLPEIIGHKKEIEIMERILAGTGINNALLVSEPGTGIERMIYALVRKSVLGQSLPELNYKRVVELDMNSLLASAKSNDEVETLLNKVFKEAVFAGNIILFIDKIYNYIGQESKPGIADISGILSSYLKMPQFLFIGITTYDGLHEHIERNSGILSQFEKVEVPEISESETMIFLEDKALEIESNYKISVSYPSLREIYNLCQKYITDLAFPEKALKVLDDVSVYVKESAKEKTVLPRHVAKIMTEKTEIPIGEMQEREKEVLKNLENLIHKRIVNQEEAVKDVSAALRRARSEITIRKGPIGAFIFLGPTGVGKTETAKALAEFYFGSEEKMVRLDMSEFQSANDISRLIGGRDFPGILTSAIKENPFSVLLLDEIEKADFNVRNLLLPVLDEGYLKSGTGVKIDFKNTIIIATSNAGYKLILEAIKEGVWAKGVKERLINYLFNDRIFQPEFLNRFDSVVVFSPLTPENIVDVAKMMLKKLEKNLKEKEITLLLNPDLIQKVADLGYDPVFGARAMRRVVQENIENPLASALISGKMKRGDAVEIKAENFELVINSPKSK